MKLNLSSWSKYLRDDTEQSGKLQTVKSEGSWAAAAACSIVQFSVSNSLHPPSPCLPVKQEPSASPGPDINPKVDLIWTAGRLRGAVPSAADSSLGSHALVSWQIPLHPAPRCWDVSVSILQGCMCLLAGWCQLLICEMRIPSKRVSICRFDSCCPGWWHLVTSNIFTVNSRCQREHPVAEFGFDGCWMTDVFTVYHRSHRH